MKGSVMHRSDITPIPLGGGVERRILAYEDPLMAVEVSFEAGAEGAPHVHPHTHTVTHTHDGTTHTHTVTHCHDHAHYITDDRLCPPVI